MTGYFLILERIYYVAITTAGSIWAACGYLVPGHSADRQFLQAGGQRRRDLFEAVPGKQGLEKVVSRDGDPGIEEGV